MTNETGSGAISASTTYAYDYADRLASVAKGTGSASPSTYDASGDPTTMANATTQVFGSAQQLTSSTPASSPTTNFSYNPSGDRTASAPASSGGGGAGSPAAISAVGPTYTGNVNSAGTAISVPVSPKTTGDLMVMGVYTYGDTSPWPSAVAGGGVTNWSDKGFLNYATGAGITIWWGVVTTAGPSDITVSFASQAGSGVAFAQEFSAGNFPTWSLDTSGYSYTKTSSTVPFPSLAPKSTGELYFGLGFSYGQAAAGSTPGFSYDIADQYSMGDGIVTFDPSVSGSVAPTATQTSSSSDAGGILISATNTGTVASSPISAVGATATAYLDSAQTGISVAVSPKATGDLMMMGVYSYGDGSPVPSSVSGGGVSSWSDKSFCGYATSASLSIWWGVVTTTGASDITVSFATKAGSGVAFAQELSAGRSPTWSLDTSGFGTTKAPSAVPFPTLSPAGTGEAYFGLGFSYGQASAGTTPGYSYEVANQYGLGDGVLAFDPSVSSATAPVATESARSADAGAVVISASRLQGASYTYDQADRLTSAAVAGTGVVGYAYNGDGLLVASASAAGTATNTWDTTAGVALLLSDGTNDYIYGPDGTPVEQAALGSGSVGYYLSDAQGSTRALLDSTGAVAATFSYDAYGNLSSTSGVMSTPLLYDGQYQDATTGLYYLRARWYDSATSQFTSVDPMVASTGQPYVYAGDNPVNAGDPSGNDPCGPVTPGQLSAGGGCYHEPTEPTSLPPAYKTPISSPLLVPIITYDLYRLETTDGMTAIEASGMLGNAYTESADTFSPSQWQTEPRDPCSFARDDGTCGIGIFQFTYGGPFDSWVPLTKFAKEHNESPLTTNAQLDFAVFELRTEGYLGLALLQQAQTPQNAADVFEANFERPANLADAPIREAQAEYIYTHFYHFNNGVVHASQVAAYC